jgi:hypothetical protein
MMKHFLMLVAVAVVASVMYVAAAPASQQSSRSTARQISSMKRQVKILNRVVNSVKHQAMHADNYVRNCLTGTEGGTVPVTEFGDALTHGYGYQYFDGTSTRYTSALDIDTTSDPGAYLQKVSRGCAKGNKGGNR